MPGPAIVVLIGVLAVIIYETGSWIVDMFRGAHDVRAMLHEMARRNPDLVQVSPWNPIDWFIVTIDERENLKAYVDTTGPIRVQTVRNGRVILDDTYSAEEFFNVLRGAQNNWALRTVQTHFGGSR